MIRFACSHCRKVIAVDSKYAQRKGKCPKCGRAVIVPSVSTVIAFACTHCARRLRVSQQLRGHKLLCPGCKESIEVPSAEENLTGAAPRPAASNVAPPATRFTAIVKRRLLLLGAVGTLLVVLIVSGIVIWLHLQSRQREAGHAEELSNAECAKIETYVEQYVDALETQDTQDTLRFYSSEFSRLASFLATDLSGQLRRLEPVDMEMERAYCVPDAEGDIYMAHCRVRGEQGTKTFILALISFADGFKVDGLAVLRRNSRSLSASPQSRDALDAVAAAAYERLRSRGQFRKIALTVLSILGLLTFGFLRRRCPACGKLWALKRTTWHYFLWFPDDGMYEYQCKACGETTWLYHGSGYG